MTRTTPILGVAIDGVGAHPAAASADGFRRTLDPAWLVGLARTAERAHLDLVTLEDSLDPIVADGDPLPFRLDALLSLAHVAAATTSIGLVATVTTTHTEPFHVSKNVATLDLVSHGRGGWRVAVSTTPAAARRFGRKDAAPRDELLAEADEVVDVVARLWDSWEDDAVIRDVPTGRYLDRTKVHYVDFEGRFFSVRGPSITPRPPQGQPIVVVDVHDAASASLAARRADVAVIDAASVGAARDARSALRESAAAVGRGADDLKVLVAASVGEPARRRSLDGVGAAPPRRSLDLAGPPVEVAATLAEWWGAGAVDGFLLRPDVLPDTIEWLADQVAPQLRREGLLGDVSAGSTLRERFGLARPANRYAASEATA